MTVESDIPDVEMREHDSSARYALRILLEIEEQQAQISATAAAQTHRAIAKSRVPKPGQNETPAAPSSTRSAPQAELSRRDLKREFDRREQALRRRLELQKWNAKYDLMLIEASPEFRLGALLKKAPGGGDPVNAIEILARLGNANSPEAHEVSAEIERILLEGEVLESLLPLLDPLPNI
jgi:hypothetical protein